MSGWFAVKRGTIEHELFEPVGPWSKFEAWAWLIESAAVTDRVINLDGHPHGVPRGAVCLSLRFLAGRWLWSVKAVRGFLDRLEAHGAISRAIVGQEKGTGRTQITLCNYEKYQFQGQSKGTEGAQEGHKEEQITIPPTEGSAAADDPGAVMFRAGRALLAEAGINGRQAGAILGKWRKAHGDAEVITALGKAKREGAIDPVAFIEGCFRHSAVKAAETAYGETRTNRNGEMVRYVGGQVGWERVYA